MAGETTITLDKPRTLKFGIRDVAQLERDLGYGIDELQARGQRLLALVALLFYGLRHEDAALTLPLLEKKLQRYIDKGGDLIAVVDATYSALYNSGVYGARMAEVSRRVDAELHPEPAPAEEEADGALPLSGSASASRGDTNE